MFNIRSILHSIQHHSYYRICLPSNIAPNRTSDIIVQGTNIGVADDCLLVLPRYVWLLKRHPLLVASTAWSIVTVFLVFVTAVVAKVWGSWVDSSKAVSLRNTRAKPGAGTRIWQTLFAQLTVWTLNSPLSRPSDSKWFPKLWMFM